MALRKNSFSLALLPVDDSQIDYLREQLLGLHTGAVSRSAQGIAAPQGEGDGCVVAVVLDESQANSRRFQAAAALAEYAPDDEHWQQTAPFVAQHLDERHLVRVSGEMATTFQTGQQGVDRPTDRHSR